MKAWLLGELSGLVAFWLGGLVAWWLSGLVVRLLGVFVAFMGWLFSCLLARLLAGSVQW